MNYHEFISAYPTLSSEFCEHRDGDATDDRGVAERWLHEPFLNGIESNLATVNAIRSEARMVLQQFALRSAAFRKVANRGLIDDDRLAEEWLRSMLAIWDEVSLRLEEKLRPR